MTEPTDSFVDDKTIIDAAPLWRRIPRHHFVSDEKLGCVRPSSAAFEDHPNGTPMSVVLGQEVLDAGRVAESVLAGHDGFGLASFPAGLAREQGQGIIRKPLSEEPAHAEVFGKKSKAVKRALAKGCEWIIPPPAQAEQASGDFRV
jgi:hypothetical protein